MRSIGEKVNLKLKPNDEKLRRVKGELVSIDNDRGTIDVVGSEVDGIDQADAQVHRLDLASIQKARTSFDWGPAPKPGGKNAGKRHAGKKNPPAKRSKQQQAQLNRDKDPS